MDVFFYELRSENSGNTFANLVQAQSFAEAENLVYGACHNTQFKVIQLWNMNVWQAVDLTGLTDNPKSH